MDHLRRPRTAAVFCALLIAAGCTPDAATSPATAEGVSVARAGRDKSAPTAPVLSVVDLGPTHVTISMRSTDDGPYIFYSLFKDGVPVVQGTQATTYTVHLLEPSTTHSFTAQARDNGINWSPVSQPLTITTAPRPTTDVQAPTAPTNLEVSGAADGSGEMLILWTASSDDVDPASIIRYDVFVNGILDGSVVARTRWIAYGVRGTNTISVRAVDTAGNVSASATATIFLDF